MAEIKVSPHLSLFCAEGAHSCAYHAPMIIIIIIILINENVSSVCIQIGILGRDSNPATVKKTKTKRRKKEKKTEEQALLKISYIS